MQGCDYRPQVQRWAVLYTKRPRQFAASWKQAMPFLLLVVDELGRRNLPGEFAMLPYVESTYRPVASHGDRAAGMWQIVPDTAREAGLVVNTDYDGRLDAFASTNAALDLIEHYRLEFADWRLADMAYNSGEFRVRKLLGERDARALSASELARLAFNPVTHEHLDRLLALSCVIDDPTRFGVILPEPRASDALQAVSLKAGMDLRLAARLAGLTVNDVSRWNAGYRHYRMAPAAPHRLWLPKDSVARFEMAADAMPIALWSDWREQRVASTSDIGTGAAQIGVPAAVLATANALDETATVTRTSALLLPGREPDSVHASTHDSDHERGYVVGSGDTLSRIAHRHSIPLGELKRLNPGANGTLHPGQQLRLGRAGTN
jgi:membrane-bound lytic murein transglycosylase D